MKWILVILSMDVSGHPHIANSSWMEPGQGYVSLQQCQSDIARQQAFHPNTINGPAVWECLAIDPSQSRTLVPYAHGQWQ